MLRDICEVDMGKICGKCGRTTEIQPIGQNHHVCMCWYENTKRGLAPADVQIQVMSEKVAKAFEKVAFNLDTAKLRKAMAPLKEISFKMDLVEYPEDEE